MDKINQRKSIYKIYKTRQIKLQIELKNKIIQVYYLKHNYHNYNLT